MMPRCSFFLGLLVAAAPITAQQPEVATGPPVLVMRGDLVNPATGDHRPIPELKGHHAICRPHQPNAIAAGDRLIDLRAGQILRTGSAIQLTDLLGKEHWQFDPNDHGLPKSEWTHGWWLHDDRVLKRTADEWLAFDRINGTLVWQGEATARRHVLIAKDLLIEVGKRDQGHVLRVRSVQNGAVACRVDLLAEPKHLAHSAHGVAVVESEGIEVFEPFGPRRFHDERKFDDVAADEHGWLLRKGFELFALDREGEPRWRCELTKPQFLDRHRMLVIGDTMVLYSDHFMSDSGVHVQAVSLAKGEVLWAQHLPGLGVPHSKYHHDTYLLQRGSCIDVVSQGSAGAFFVTLDTASGEQQQRVKVQ